MPIGYLFKPGPKLAIVAWDGSITWNHWKAHLQRYMADPEFAPMKIQITDLRFSSLGPSISEDQIREMASLVIAQRQRLSLQRVAIVAGNEWPKSKLAEFGLGLASVTAITFNELTTACLWLGVDVVEVGRDIQQIRRKLRETSETL